MSKLSKNDIIILKEAELVAALKIMPDEELEDHAFSLVEELGGNDFGALMKLIMKELEGEQSNQKRYLKIQSVLRDTLPNKAVMSDIYERLATILMLILVRKYKKILEAK